MKKSIFILGSNGLLGSKLTSYFKKKIPFFETYTVARLNSDYNINLENFTKLKKIILSSKIDYLINCAAHTKIKECEKSYKKIYKINVLLPKFLSEISKKKNFKYIHISTDSIYSSNKKNHLNKEDDKINFTNNYSKSKLVAEKFCNKNKNNLIVRTNFVDFNKNSFPKWLYNNLKKKKTINLYNDLFTSSVDVGTCAKIIIKMIMKNLKGVYNLGSHKPTSKQQFAVLFANKLGFKLKHKSVSANNYCLKRNLNLGMNSNKLEKKLKLRMISTKKVINNLIKNVHSGN
tara:strand:- start:1278 stop:2144 length:867 start_codon:yes stop_codon:yes gene_type:complete